MDKKIVVLVRAGLPYRNTILYGKQRAREANAKLLLVGVIPDMDSSSRRFSFATYELASYETITRKLEEETSDYLERAVQFCLDNCITVETAVASGGLQGAVSKYSKDEYAMLVVVPTPTKREHHSEFLDAIKHFTHDMIDYKLRCPVVSVLAT
jgi:hypothetical protein